MGGHVSAPVEGKIWLWGQLQARGEESFEPSIHFFHPLLESWSVTGSSGLHPPGVKQSACTSAGHYMYTLGGSDNAGTKKYGSLHQLDTKTLTWSLLSSTGPTKHGCGMVAYSDKLILFGGYGDIPSHPGAEFNSGSGWSNELNMFDLKKGERMSC